MGEKKQGTSMGVYFTDGEKPPVRDLVVSRAEELGGVLRKEGDVIKIETVAFDNGDTAKVATIKNKQ